MTVGPGKIEGEGAICLAAALGTISMGGAMGHGKTRDSDGGAL